MKHKLLYLIFTTIIAFTSISQTHVNREWMDVTGNPDTLAWSSSIINGDNELIHVGNTQVAGQNVQMLITKYDSTGTIIWQETFSHDSLYHDFGVAVGFDENKDIYIAGTSKHIVSSKAMITVVKFNNNGTFQWYENYFSGGTAEDYTTDLAVTPTGDVYISASSKTDTTDFDFLALSYNSSGTLQWDTRYDYNALVDFSVKIGLTDSRVILTGASALSSTRWHFTTVSFNRTNGAFISEERDNLPGVGYDVPAAFSKDAMGNFYLAGRSSTDGIDYDFRTIKLDSAFNIVWSKTFDLAGKKDEGLSVAVDTLGNVYVGGYVTRTDNVEEMYLVKYNENGDFQWKHQQPGNDPKKDARIIAVELNAHGELYYVGQESKKNGNIRSVIGKFNPNGKTIYQRYTEAHSIVDEFPTTLRIDSDNHPYFTAIVDDLGNYHYVIRKYTEFTQSADYEIDQDSIPLFRSNELIVRFKQSALVDSMFYKEYQGKKIEFDSLHNFLTTQAMNAIDNALKNFYTGWDNRIPNPEGIMAVKMFKQLDPDYKKTISRSGDTIRVPDFWTTLLVSLPPSISIEDFYTNMLEEGEHVAYSELNYIQVDNELNVNDPLFDNQLSIKEDTYFDIPNAADDTAHVNVVEAWEIYPDAGSEYIKCGVFDRAINDDEGDFSGGSWTGHPSKVRDGWDFVSGGPISAAAIDFTTEIHGTQVAAIIGAIRNNDYQVAGIAGGNYTGNYVPSDTNYFSDKGVSLYSLRILSFTENPIQNIYDAIVMAGIDDTLSYTFGIHLANHSWGIGQISAPPWYIDTNFTLLAEAMHFSNRMGVAQVAARGNFGDTIPVYPGSTDEDWIITVGGTGNNGYYKHIQNGLPNTSASSYGFDLDIAAPYAINLIQTIPVSSTFGGTSASAAHASGAVALLMSYWNDTLPNYKNLSPKDCERLLELAAINTENRNGYDEYVGWGRLNIGGSMRLIEDSYGAINHFGSNNNTSSYTQHDLHSSNVAIHINEHVKNTDSIWFNKGDYLVNIHKITSTFQHEIDSKDSIFSFWQRPSSSSLFGPPIDNNILIPREKIIIDTLNRDSCVTHGFVYEVFDLSSNFLGWLPHDTTLSISKLEYTILTRDTLAPQLVNISELSNPNFNVQLFPNPSSQYQKIVIYGHSNENVQINMFDIQGRKIKKVFSGTLKGETSEIELDLSNVSDGVYVHQFIFDTGQHSVKFIKQ